LGRDPRLCSQEVFTFIDERGQPVAADRITAPSGLYFFKHHPDKVQEHAKVRYDIRSPKSTAEYLHGLGAIPVPCPMGHALIKTMLRPERGLYAGELTGHYYFRDFFYCDSVLLAVLIMLDILCRKKKRLSELVGPPQRYYSTGELGFTMENAEGIIKEVRQASSAGTASEISGLRIDFSDWWFVLRAGSTEPTLRLVIEADTEDKLKRRKAELTNLILKKQRDWA
jgi:phosphomannomutase